MEKTKTNHNNWNQSIDPLQVRTTTLRIIKDLKFIRFHKNRIKPLAKKLKTRIHSLKLLDDTQFGKKHVNPQRVFIQDAVNFCFWSKKGKPKWLVEYPPNTINDGWEALVSCFERALDNGIPVLDADYLSNISTEQAKILFKSSNGIEVPLLKERTLILRETGKLLNNIFSGRIEKLIKKSKHDAALIAASVIKIFPSFNDTTIYRGKKICFFKRAQIFTYDLSMLKKVKITNTNRLTAFADYKLPQLLRSFGILQYKKPLAKKVDSFKLIPKSSREEIEIRSATIWACEYLATILKVPPVIVDNALWKLAHETTRKMKPYHRTLTIFY